MTDVTSTTLEWLQRLCATDEGTLLPAQIRPRMRDLGPEVKLALAVLTDAMHNLDLLRSKAPLTKPKDIAMERDLIDWFTSTEVKPFSFCWVCEVLELIANTEIDSDRARHNILTAQRPSSYHRGRQVLTVNRMRPAR